ncbi:MAG TPA: AbrB/MazE/SpoVT family DNA-binding domain-containing protein [Symbiobacteriaceae bacterium]|jgi:transcriptional pleiotropic regulator of transition state genes
MMKPTGMIRKLDELGRVVIPIELRRVLGMGDGDGLEIFVNGDFVVLRKYEPACVFCGGPELVTFFKGKNVCQACLCEMAGELERTPARKDRHLDKAGEIRPAKADLRDRPARGRQAANAPNGGPYWAGLDISRWT